MKSYNNYVYIKRNSIYFLSCLLTLIIIIHFISIFITGFTGKDCDRAIVPCDENPCQNEAVCLLEDEHPVCYCVPDYHGALCELKYDDCESKFAQCDNGGTCIDGINSFTCSCLPNYSGPMCEYSFTSTIIAVEDTSEQGTSSMKTTTAIPPRGSTSVADTSVSLSSTSDFATYSMSSRTTNSLYTKSYTIMEKTTMTSEYEDRTSPSVSSKSGIFLTEIPTGFTTSKDMTRDDVMTSEVVTMSSAVTEAFSHVTETEGVEVYSPTGRSIHDGKVTKDVDQTTYSPTSEIVDEDLTRVTEYMTTFR